MVTDATAISPYNYQTTTVTGGSTLTVKFPDSSWFGGSTRTTTVSETTTSFAIPPGSLTYPEPPTGDSQWTSTVDEVSDYGTSTYTGSFSTNTSQNWSVLVLNQAIVNVTAGYTANWQCTETVAFSLFADVQPILTDPDDGEALLINDVKSVNLSEAIDGVVPIGHPAGRSYIATPRGNQSLEHLIALARANLMKRSRVVEIAFAPKLARMPEITLRKNALLIEPRVGEATGKIIGYSLGLEARRPGQLRGPDRLRDRPRRLAGR